MSDRFDFDVYNQFQQVLRSPTNGSLFVRDSMCAASVLGQQELGTSLWVQKSVYRHLSVWARLVHFARAG